MKKKLITNNSIILNIILSNILTLLLFALFKIDNNVFFSLIINIIIYYCIDKYKSHKKTNREYIFISILSFLLSLVFTIQSKIVFSGNVHGKILDNTILDFEGIDIFKIIVLFAFIYIVLFNSYFLLKTNGKFIFDKSKSLSEKEQWYFWLKSSILVFIPFFIFLLIKYPGFVTADSIESIMQGIDRIPLTNHHPVIYNIFVGFVMHVGKFFVSYNFGVFLYSLFQLSIMSVIIGYFLLWLRKHNIKFIFIIFIYLFYVSNVLFASYSITMWKDPLFSCALLLLSLYLYDIVKQDGDQLTNIFGIAKFVSLVLFIAFLRNNGIYIILGLFVVLLFVYKKSLLSFHISFGITIILIIIVQGPIYNLCGIVSPTEESLAIPIQQIARTISSDGEISENNIEFLNKILPINKWKEKYEPMSVDSLKWDDEFDVQFLADNKVKFLKVWGEILPRNINTYIDAYLLDTYGFWSIGVQNDYGLVGSKIISNELFLRNVNFIEEWFGFNIDNFIPKTSFIGSGTMLWIIIINTFIILLLSKAKYIITLLPCLFSFATILIATPVAFSLRYVFMVALALPFIILIPFMVKEEKQN